MRNAFALATFLIALVGGAATASAHSVRYMSKHPLPRKVGHGFCYINVPHFHDYPPSDPRLYRQVEGQYYFVGDPAPFDYEGPRYSYYGAHPIADVDVHFGHPTYCYLRGPHYHWYAPPPQAQFELKGGAYWYVGAYDPVYYDERPRYAAVNDAYAPIAYVRPVVDVHVAPPAFHGEIVAVAPGVSAGIVVGAPAPPPPPVLQVGVGINLGAPPPPVVVQQRTVYVHDRHDHGWHGGPPPGPPHGGWRGQPPPPPGGWRGGPTPPAQHGGGWRGAAPGVHQTTATHGGGGGWRGGPGQPAHHKNGGWKR
jgi:hypothetical protein